VRHSKNLISTDQSMLRNVQPQPDPSTQHARNPLRMMLVFCNLSHQLNRLDKVSVRPNSAIHSLDPFKSRNYFSGSKQTSKSLSPYNCRRTSEFIFSLDTWCSYRTQTLLKWGKTTVCIGNIHCSNINFSTCHSLATMLMILLRNAVLSDGPVCSKCDTPVMLKTVSE
jgi:hypothetical protein